MTTIVSGHVPRIFIFLMDHFPCKLSVIVAGEIFALLKKLYTDVQQWLEDAGKLVGVEQVIIFFCNYFR